MKGFVLERNKFRSTSGCRSIAKVGIVGHNEGRDGQAAECPRFDAVFADRSKLRRCKGCTECDVWVEYSSFYLEVVVSPRRRTTGINPVARLSIMRAMYC